MSASVGFGFSLQQRHRRHDLAGLAIAALRHLDPLPGRLHGCRRLAGDAFDRRDVCPSTPLTGVEHERVGWPSMCTVQAPHCAMPQPNLVPVRPATSRIAHSNGISGSTSKLTGFPFNTNETAMTLSLNQMTIVDYKIFDCRQ